MSTSATLVRVPDAQMPDLARFAFGALTSAMSGPDRWHADGTAAAEVGRVATEDRDGRVWVWDHNGAGDFVRISSARYGRRLLVCFNHESDRSPWGRDGQLPAGLEWLPATTLAEVRASDVTTGPDQPPNITEAYTRFSVPPGDEPQWHTSPVIAVMAQQLRDGEEFGPDGPLGELCDRLIAGERPPLAELIAACGHDLTAAAACIAMHRIDRWLDEREF